MEENKDTVQNENNQENIYEKSKEEIEEIKNSLNLF